MENKNEELPELRALYDELWADAKTLFKDMRRSIMIYLYAGIITLFVSALSITAAVSYLNVLFSGSFSRASAT